MEPSRTGTLGEIRAALALDALGWRLLERGFRCRGGELDLVALEGEVLVFVEVKARTGSEHGLRAVGLKKRLRILRAAKRWRRSRRMTDRRVRFDVALITPAGLELVRGAFHGPGFEPEPRRGLRRRLAELFLAVYNTRVICPACKMETPESQPWCDFCKEPFRKKEAEKAPPPKPETPKVALSPELMMKLQMGKAKPEPGALDAGIPPEFAHLDSGERIQGLPPAARKLAYGFLVLTLALLSALVTWLLLRPPRPGGPPPGAGFQPGAPVYAPPQEPPTD